MKSCEAAVILIALLHQILNVRSGEFLGQENLASSSLSTD